MWPKTVSIASSSANGLPEHLKNTLLRRQADSSQNGTQQSVAGLIISLFFLPSVAIWQHRPEL